MVHIVRPPPWRVPESAITPESAWLSRRELLRGLGTGAAAAAIGGPEAFAAGPVPTGYAYDIAPAPRNANYAVDRPLTDEAVAASYNNFYEFTTDKAKVWELAHTLQARPWLVYVKGEVERQQVFSIDDLLKKMPLEERTYRFRCVEAWSMTVPWLGFPLAALLEQAKPLSSAKYVRLVTMNAPYMFPGVASQPWYNWPYHEGLTIREATNELAFMAVGIYGHALPNQHGAPLRLVVPWKYGFKNIKSIQVIELTSEQPPTFWNEVAAEEYDFSGNVRPDVPHPRWSQATERVIPTGERIATLMYNGYADQVAPLYR